MQELQALIQGKVSAQMIDIDRLIELAQHYKDPNSAEYKLVELATNIILAQYLEKAQTVL